MSGSDRMARQALIIVLVPIVFHSLFGTHKALRFFAVLFPLLSVAAGVQIGGLIHALAERIRYRQGGVNLAARFLIPLITLLIVHGGADGPARHLTLATGFREAIARLPHTGPDDGTVSSHNWEVVRYGRSVPSTRISFAYWGTQETDRWILLDEVLGRVTVEYHLRLSGVDIDPESAWAHQRDFYIGASDSLFSVRNDFYSSDYFLCELVPQGIDVLRRWRALRPPEGSFLTVREFRERKHRVVPIAGKRERSSSTTP